MVTGDPLRTPTLILFADPNYNGSTGMPDCDKPCVAINPTSAWDHGDLSPDINTTWLGIAGPGVRRGGVDSQTWADHTDVRPTLLALLGLRDSYSSDGRVLFEELDTLPAGIADEREQVTALARDYKRINAPVGELGLTTIAASTFALTNPDEAQLAQTDAALDELAARRADLAGRMRLVLESAAFAGQRADTAAMAALQAEAQALLDDAHALPHS
jgi:arylsulfatase A-like enzyme